MQGRSLPLRAGGGGGGGAPPISSYTNEVHPKSCDRCKTVFINYTH